MLLSHVMLHVLVGNRLLAHCYNGQYFLYNTNSAHLGPLASFGDPATYTRNAHTWCAQLLHLALF